MRKFLIGILLLLSVNGLAQTGISQMDDKGVVVESQVCDSVFFEYDQTIDAVVAYHYLGGSVASVIKFYQVVEGEYFHKDLGTVYFTMDKNKNILRIGYTNGWSTVYSGKDLNF